MAYIEIKNLNFHYKKINPILKDINISINKGDWVSIIGHNGSGKSTLSKLIVGLQKARSGSITIDGVDLNKDTVNLIRRKIGIVFQNPDNQFVGVTVKDDIAFGMENLQYDRETMLSKIEEVSTKVSMNDFLDKQPHQLSGGQKQRVAIAGVLAMNPEIIIFDEATSMLDPKGCKEIITFIKELQKTGVTIITITHEMKEIVNSDQVIVLKNGKVLLNDKPTNVLLKTDILKHASLESLTTIKILDMLKEHNFSNKKVEDILWQFSLKM